MLSITFMKIYNMTKKGEILNNSFLNIYKTKKIIIVIS